MSEAPSPRQAKTLGKIARMARENGLSGEQIRAFIDAPPAPGSAPDGPNFLTGLLGYLGGALVLSGLCIYAKMIWGDIGSFARVFISLGSGSLAFMIGAILQNNGQTHKAALPLWIVSAGLIPTGLFVFLHEYAKGDDPILGGTIVFGLCLVIFLMGFLRFRRSALLFFTFLFGVAFAGTCYEYLGINTPMMWLVSGVSMFALALRVRRSDYENISALPFVMAGTMVTASAYYYLGNGTLEVLMATILLGMIFAGYMMAERGLLIFSTVSFLILISKYFGFCWGYLDSDILKTTAAVTGASMMFTALWIGRHTESRLAPWWNFFGSNLLFSAFMGLLYETPMDVLFPALPAIVLYFSLKTRSRALLLSSILALLAFISYYSAEYFADTLGWPIALMIAGMALIGLCTLALRMNARIKSGTANA